MYGTRNSVLLLLVGLIVLGMGCARPSLAPLIPATPSQRSESLEQRKPTWGPEAEGLQCRLRATKRLWRPTEAPTFKLDLRNRGERIFAVATVDSNPSYRVIVDGRQYRVSPPPGTETRIKPLAPGTEFSNLIISLPREVHTSLAPGPHTVQIAFAFEGVEVVSNPVGIEIAGPP